MSNVQLLVMAKDEYQAFDHPWNRRATRFLRDLRMLARSITASVLGAEKF